MRNLFICVLSLSIAFKLSNTFTLGTPSQSANFFCHDIMHNASSMKKMTEQALSFKNEILELRRKMGKFRSDELDMKNMEARLYEAQQIADKMNIRYEQYIRYSKSQSLYDPSTLKNFYTEVLDKLEGVTPLLFAVYDWFIDRGNSSLITILERNIEKLDPSCETRKSRQRFFYDLFLSIMSHQSKGFFILQYAFDLKRVMETKSVNREMQVLDELCEKVVYSIVTAFTNVMSRAEKTVWRCDPTAHVENETYVELKNVFRRILYDARDITKGYNLLTCNSESCPAIHVNKHETPKCLKNNCYLKQRHCSGLVTCRQLKKDEEYNVCVSKEQNYGRRYTYVKDSKESLFSVQDRCDGQFRGMFPVVQSYPGAIMENVCNVCDCVCDESLDSDNSDQYISLKPVTSDTHRDYVITGVKLELVNHTIYIRIQQSKLLAHGVIDGSSTKWKNIMAASNDKTQPEVNIVLIGLMEDNASFKNPKYEIENPSIPMYEEEIFKLEWHNKRGLYLDDLEVKKGEVVTGVRFVLEKTKEQGTFVALSVQATPFNFKSGKLAGEKSYWILTGLDPFKRHKIQINDYDVPTLLKVFNKPDGRPHKYLEFAPSALTSKDAGQTLLPLIDIQPVTSDPPVPLMGVSLDIKRAENSGGFLMLKTKTYDTLWNLNDIL